ncbi:hypothetical protein C8Q74DRAFT_250929 [Fomes fomentarius]|nr:hypothetical protein C8Q74DRAFT_250929 [Fomes fomentarius]
MSFSLNPATSSIRPGRLPRASQARSSQQGLYYAEELVLGHLPGYKPTSDAEVRATLRRDGYKGEQIQLMIDYMNSRAEEMHQRGGFHVIGVKPDINDNDIHTVILNDEFVIRIWDGGMEEFGQFCLDFVDRKTRTPVNLPPGYGIGSARANMPGVFMPGAFTSRGQLPSMEQCYGYTPDKIPPGAEKWAVPAGAYITITKNGTEVVTFKVPVREYHRNLVQQVVQPVRGAVW